MLCYVVPEGSSRYNRYNTFDRLIDSIAKIHQNTNSGLYGVDSICEYVLIVMVDLLCGTII